MQCYPSCTQLLADHGNGMAGRRGAVISWRHSWSIVRFAAVSEATQAGTSSHRRELRNECTRPTAECEHQSLAVINHRQWGWALSWVASSISYYTGSWLVAWKWTALSSVACLHHRDVLGLKRHGVRAFLYLFSSVLVRMRIINLHLPFDLGFAHHRCPYSAVWGRQ